MQSRANIKHKIRDLTPLVAAAAAAGLIASIPMGLAMMGLNRTLPGRRRFPDPADHALPPKQITGEVAERVGASEVMRPGPRWDTATWLAHIGYGAATASLYPLVTRPLPLPEPLRGAAYAMGVWAGSYLGWLPAADILPPATEQPARRNAVMILSHLLWGALTGVITRAMLNRQRQSALMIE